jgi:hypothetical protein
MVKQLDFNKTLCCVLLGEIWRRVLRPFSCFLGNSIYKYGPASEPNQLETASKVSLIILLLGSWLAAAMQHKGPARAEPSTYMKHHWSLSTRAPPMEILQKRSQRKIANHRKNEYTRIDFTREFSSNQNPRLKNTRTEQR